MILYNFEDNLEIALISKVYSMTSTLINIHWSPLQTETEIVPSRLQMKWVCITSCFFQNEKKRIYHSTGSVLLHNRANQADEKYFTKVSLCTIDSKRHNSDYRQKRYILYHKCILILFIMYCSSQKNRNNNKKIYFYYS